MSAPWPNNIPHRRDYIAERGLDEYLYLVNPDDLQVYRFESAGRKVWGLIDGQRSGGDLARAYCQAKGIPHSPRLQTLVNSFLDNLRARDLIYTQDEPGLRRARVCTHSGEGTRLSEPAVTGAGAGAEAESNRGNPRAADSSDDVINEMWHRASRHKTILKCDLEVTYACNHKCLHCYNPSERRKTLSTQQFLDLIDTLADEGCLFLGFTGGEVFVRPDIMTLARRARARKFSIRMLTNGALIDEDLADQIAEIHPETVEISLLGTSPETHDHFAQAPGSFAKIVRACELLSEREVNVYARYVFTRHNVYEAPELPSLAADLGIKYVYQKPHLLPTVDRDLGPTDHRLTDEQTKWLYQQGIWKPSGSKSCYAGVARCSVSPWGEIHACEFFPTTIGTVRDDSSLRQVWLGSEARSAWDDSHVHNPSGCRDCSNRDICIRCPAMAFLEDGSLTSSSARSCQVSGIVRAAEAEMRDPNWRGPGASNAWTQDLVPSLTRSLGRQAGSQFVTLRVPNRARTATAKPTDPAAPGAN